MGQEEHETLETLLRYADLSFAKTTVGSCFHADGPGRPPRNPMHGVLQNIHRHENERLRRLREMTKIPTRI